MQKLNSSMRESSPRLCGSETLPPVFGVAIRPHRGCAHTHKPTKYARPYRHTCIHADIHIHTCMHASMHSCLDVCICAYVQVHMRKCIHPHSYTCFCTFRHSHMKNVYICKCLDLYFIHARINTCVGTFAHCHMHIHVHRRTFPAYMPKNMHICIDVFIWGGLQGCIHAYLGTHAPMRRCKCDADTLWSNIRYMCDSCVRMFCIFIQVQVSHTHILQTCCTVHECDNILTYACSADMLDI